MQTCYFLHAGGHVLVLGSGSNILGLMAAQGGARRVTCIEKGPMLYRMGKQTLSSNRQATWAKNIVILDRRLQACCVQGTVSLAQAFTHDDLMGFKV